MAVIAMSKGAVGSRIERAFIQNYPTKSSGNLDLLAFMQQWHYQ
jgi:hypothetical protein